MDETDTEYDQIDLSRKPSPVLELPLPTLRFSELRRLTRASELTSASTPALTGVTSDDDYDAIAEFVEGEFDPLCIDPSLLLPDEKEIENAEDKLNEENGEGNQGHSEDGSFEGDTEQLYSVQPRRSPPPTLPSEQRHGRSRTGSERRKYSRKQKGKWKESDESPSSTDSQNDGDMSGSEHSRPSTTCPMSPLPIVDSIRVLRTGTESPELVSPLPHANNATHWTELITPLLAEFATRQINPPLGQRLSINLSDRTQFVLGTMQHLANRPNVEHDKAENLDLLEQYVDIERWACEYLRTHVSLGTGQFHMLVPLLLTIIVNQLYESVHHVMDEVIKRAMANFSSRKADGGSTLDVNDFAFAFDVRYSHYIPFLAQSSVLIRETLEEHRPRSPIHVSVEPITTTRSGRVSKLTTIAQANAEDKTRADAEKKVREVKKKKAEQKKKDGVDVTDGRETKSLPKRRNKKAGEQEHPNATDEEAAQQRTASGLSPSNNGHPTRFYRTAAYGQRPTSRTEGNKDRSSTQMYGGFRNGIAASCPTCGRAYPPSDHQESLDPFDPTFIATGGQAPVFIPQQMPLEDIVGNIVPHPSPPRSPPARYLYTPPYYETREQIGDVSNTNTIPSVPADLTCLSTTELASAILLRNTQSEELPPHPSTLQAPAASALSTNVNRGDSSLSAPPPQTTLASGTNMSQGSSNAEASNSAPFGRRSLPRVRLIVKEPPSTSSQGPSQSRPSTLTPAASSSKGGRRPVQQPRRSVAQSDTTNLHPPQHRNSSTLDVVEVSQPPAVTTLIQLPTNNIQLGSVSFTSPSVSAYTGGGSSSSTVPTPSSRPSTQNRRPITRTTTTLTTPNNFSTMGPPSNTTSAASKVVANADQPVGSTPVHSPPEKTAAQESEQKLAPLPIPTDLAISGALTTSIAGREQSDVSTSARQRQGQGATQDAGATQDPGTTASASVAMAPATAEVSADEVDWKPSTSGKDAAMFRREPDAERRQTRSVTAASFLSREGQHDAMAFTSMSGSASISRNVGLSGSTSSISGGPRRKKRKLDDTDD